MSVQKPMHIEDIQPYLTGSNVLEFTNSNSADQPVEAFTGVISKIVPIEAKGVVTSLSLNLLWVVRIRSPIPSKGSFEYEDFDPMPNSWHTNYDIAFDRPLLIQKRSPLTFVSDRSTVQISHVTNLAKVVLWIQNRDEILSQLRS